ncbi:hypothetical protein [Flavobacterium algicola]|uniref:hypothetical protein n=1 Tax=Flavobacterium algicola TaxID=556529 RepID=UPI001EFEE51E|nr:hypothetical protein [Flavobacterium algicola]MCG9790932.1 hypothetical protein [Flavobacterium algicola]
MRKLSLIIVLIVQMYSPMVSAANMLPKKTYSRINSELATLLNPSSSDNELESATIVRVVFKINNDNEIIVLDTDSTDENLNEFIMNSLHLKKLSTDELSVDSEYIFKINFRS